MIIIVKRSYNCCDKIKTEVINMERRKSICKALDYIDDYFSAKIDVNILAKISGYSVPQFIRLFTKWTGITPIRYLNIIRVLNAASILISDKPKSITKIAFDCGFDSLEVFERNFKKYFGVSASKFYLNKCVSPSPFYLSEQIYYERIRNYMIIDNGNSFDWGKTAKNYALSRNIYPQEFWNDLHLCGVGKDKQKILDIGTGTGILPLNMIKFGGKYTGVDLSSEMIKQAKSLNSNITYLCSDAHQLPFENNSFDVVTALQCWVYFDKESLLPELKRVLKRDGNLYVMFLTWLPDEDKIIKKSLDLVKKYNHKWSGFMKRADCLDLHWLNKDFSVQNIIKKDYQIPFSRNEWCNRMIASRGIGATLSDDKILEFKKDLIKMLNMGTDEYFTTLHEAVILKLKRED